jgi:hypothetical protein
MDLINNVKRLEKEIYTLVLLAEKEKYKIKDKSFSFNDFYFKKVNNIIHHNNI